MNPLVIVALITLLVPILTRGSYKSLAAARFELGGVLLVGLALQILLELDVVPESRWHDIGFGLLVASYVLVIGFCLRNLDKRGMGVLMIGVLANALAIVVNQGMPVDVPSDWLADGSYQETVKHHAQGPDDTLIFLTDIIVLPSPFDTVISFGDLVMLVGVADVVFHASRRVRRTRATYEPSDEDVDIATLLRVTDTYLTSVQAPSTDDNGMLVDGSNGNGATDDDGETDETSEPTEPSAAHWRDSVSLSETLARYDAETSDSSRRSSTRSSASSTAESYT
jgi:hypothetical protein